MKRGLLNIIAPVVAAAVSACGGTPTSPTLIEDPTLLGNSTSTRVALRGIVTGYEGAPLTEAIVEVIDGVNAGRRAVTDAEGRYSFTGLQLGDMTLRASAVDYATFTKSYTLTTDTSLTIQLRVLLARIVIVGDTLEFVRKPDGMVSVQAQAVNTGDGCAAELVGTATLVDDEITTVATLTSTMPSDQILRPGERYLVDFCCLTRDEATAVEKWRANFKWVTVHCP